MYLSFQKSYINLNYYSYSWHTAAPKSHEEKGLNIKKRNFENLVIIYWKMTILHII